MDTPTSRSAHTGTQRLARRAGASLILLGAVTAAGPALADGWQKIMQRDGIVVHQKAVPGRALPMFRGRTVIRAPAFEILAVLEDLSRHCEWMHRCAEARLIERVSPTERYMYSRTDVPFPAWDRDAVMHSRVVIAPGARRIETVFEATAHPKVPPLEGVVRIRHLRGRYRLLPTGPAVTRVEYIVDADPGGSVPVWLVAQESRSVPYRTLRDLRRQVDRTRGQYAAAVKAWRLLTPRP